jgi:hypothetical protein
MTVTMMGALKAIATTSASGRDAIRHVVDEIGEEGQRALADDETGLPDDESAPPMHGEQNGPHHCDCYHATNENDLQHRVLTAEVLDHDILQREQKQPFNHR